MTRPPVGSVTELAQARLKRTVVISAASLGAVFLAYAVYSTRGANREAERLIVEQAAGLARSAALQQDYLSIQRELSRFSETISRTQDFSANVTVTIGGRLVAATGAMDAQLLSTNLREAVMLPSGELLEVRAVIGHSRRIVGTLLELLLAELALLGVFFWMGRSMSRSIESIARPLFNSIEWVERVSRDLPRVMHHLALAPRAGVREVQMLNESVELLLREISKLEDALSETHRAKGRMELAEQVVHDIRAPLALLKVAIHTASEGVPRDSLEAFGMAVERIQGITDELLSERRSALASLTRARVWAIAERLVFEKSLAWSPPARLALLPSTPVEGEVGVPPSDLERAISNLLENAYDALGSERREISLRIEDLGPEYRISVSDTGHGIPAEVLESIRAGRFLTTKSSGNGLGLKGLFDLTESAGGRVEIESAVNRGTTVRVYLPPATPLATLSARNHHDPSRKGGKRE